MKGIGPLSFNQLWHSMCLCGVLPPGLIQCTGVAPGSGPAKLIATFYPYLKKAEVLSKKLKEVKKELSNLGFKKITEFFLENLMCEGWRIAGIHRLFRKDMSNEDKCGALLSEEFQQCLRVGKPTRHPDIYYRNPFTDEYQQLFRVIDKELVMRPSFVANSATGSVNMTCNMECDIISGTISVTWSGDLLKSIRRDVSKMFI